MADTLGDDIAHLEQLALTLRRRLRVLEIQAASFGALAVPPHIVLELEDTQRELTRTLATCGACALALSWIVPPILAC